MNVISNNFIIANYGASQGFDTDDGSSWYDIRDNFMFMADGWKMDYGGHDSSFTGNVVCESRILCCYLPSLLRHLRVRAAQTMRTMTDRTVSTPGRSFPVTGQSGAATSASYKSR